VVCICVPTRENVTAKISAKKVQKGLKWEQISKMLGQSPVWTAAALGGQSYLAPEDCEKIANTFELTEEECKALQNYPCCGALDDTVPDLPPVKSTSACERIQPGL